MSNRNRTLVIGHTDQHISLLTEIDPPVAAMGQAPAAAAATTAAPASTFAAQLRENLNRSQPAPPTGDEALRELRGEILRLQESLGQPGRETRP